MRFIRTALVTVAALSIAGSAYAQSVGVGTGPSASLTNRIGSGIAKVIADGAGLNTRAVPHTANSQHTPLVERGTLTYGVSSTGDINDAVAGTGAFVGHPVGPDWVTAARVVPLPVGTLVRKDSPYQTLKDMKGKKYACGFTAQKTVLAILNGYLWNAGMTDKDLDCVNVPNTSAGTELFLKGTVEGTPSSLGGARLRDAAAKVNGIRILKMFNTPDTVAAMQKAYPGSYLIKLGDQTIGVEGETWTMAFDMILMTSTKTPEDIVYKSVKALHAGKDALVKISPVFNDFIPENMDPQLPNRKLHPGAAKFYKEMGILKSGS